MANDELAVIDLSHHNTVTDFQAIKNAGIIGVIHKATEGLSFVDRQYEPRQAAARAVGLKWGAYHFLKHGNAAGQMKHFVGNIDLPYGSRIALDYEHEACTLQDLRDSIDWLKANAPDLQIAVYGGSLLKQHLGRDYYGWLAANTSLWLAQYTNGTPAWPKNVWPHWTLWQYTDKAKVAGIKGPVDGNRFNGSAENAAKWFGPAEMPAPAPEPEPAPLPAAGVVNITIQAPEGVTVNVAVNGKAV